MTYPPQQPQQPSQYAPWQQPQQPPHTHYPQQQNYNSYNQPTRTQQNPFAGTPASDWVRDGAAAILLLASLALNWSLSFTNTVPTMVVAASRVEVLLITLLSTLSIAVGYLARFHVFGASFTAPRAALLRALLNAPYLLLILVYTVLDAALENDFNQFNDVHLGGGLGAAATIGLAGAILAAVPRRYEILTPEFSTTAAKHGYLFALGFFIFSCLITVLGTILSLISTIKMSKDANTFMILVSILLVIVTNFSPLLLGFFVIRRSETVRQIAQAFGVATIFATLIATFASQSGLNTLWQTFGYMPLIISGFAGIMSHPGLAYAMHQKQPLALWHTTLKITALVGLILFAFCAVSVILSIIFHKGQNIGLLIGLLISLVLSIVAALILRMQIIANFHNGRTISASIAGGIGVLGLAAIILIGIHNGDMKDSITSLQNLPSILPSMMIFNNILTLPTIITIFFAPVGLLIYGLFAPKEIRNYFSSMRPQQQQHYAAFPQPQQPNGHNEFGSPYPNTPPPLPSSLQELAAKAANPATTPQEQFELIKHRELWPYLAQNPSLYPDLAQWLKQQS